MSRHKVEITGVNTANIKVLTSEETLELFIKKDENNNNIKNNRSVKTFLTGRLIFIVIKQITKEDVYILFYTLI